MSACSLVLQLEVYPRHVTNYMQANEPKSLLIRVNLHAYSISSKNVHIFTYFLNRMQNTKQYCSRSSLSHSWNRLIYKLFIVSPNTASKISKQNLSGAVLPYKDDIKVIFLNNDPLKHISKWYWSRGRQTVAWSSQIAIILSLIFSPCIFPVKTESHCMRIICKLVYKQWSFCQDLTKMLMFCDWLSETKLIIVLGSFLRKTISIVLLSFIVIINLPRGWIV